MSTPLEQGEPPQTRFVVEELGPRWFVITDTVTQLSYNSFFTRKKAQFYTDLRNAASREDAS